MKTELTELTEIRNRLYDRMPSGDISAWELLQTVKLHLDELDQFIDKMDTQCVLSNVVGQSEQLQGFFDFYKKKFGGGFNTDVLEITLKQYKETL